MATQIDTKPNPFMTCHAAQVLQGLARHPVNLADPQVLTPERLSRYCSQACGLKWLYGTEKINDEVMAALKALAHETCALEKMRRMQEGDIVNYIENYPSENRPALHTATRDFFEHPQTASRAQEATALARLEVDKLKSFMAKVDTERKFKELIMVAIGGSDLGPRAHYYGLQYLQKPDRKFHFISNIDPDDAAAVLKQVNLAQSLVLVVSKSGTTIDTFTNEEIVRAKFKDAGLDPKEHFISVTTPKSPLDDRSKYLETFYMWDWVGGRFSTTSMSGGVLLAFAFGVDVYMELLRGANAMDKIALEPDLRYNLPLLAALLGIWNHNFLGYSTTAFITYSQMLYRYAAHLQQVDMESNGKLIDQQGHFVDFQTGAITWGEPGTNAQHSFFQLIHQGTATIPVCMLGFKRSVYNQDLQIEGTTSQQKLLSNLFAQSLALATGQQSDNPNKVFPGNRPTSVLIGERLTPYTIGAILSLFEHKAVFQGFIWGINSFDQEGVQLGKVLANKISARFAAKNGTIQNHTPYPLADALLSQLDNFQ